MARPSLTLQGHCLPSHSCLCLYTFLVQIISWGAASYFLTGQNGSYWGYLDSLLSSSLSTVLTHSPRAWVSRLKADRAAWAAGLPVLEQPGSGEWGRSGSSRSSLLLMSKCSSLGWSEVATLTQGIHTKDLFLKPEIFCYWPSIANRMTSIACLG